MSVDWDTELLAPVMAVFGEGTPGVPSSWPTFRPLSGPVFQLPDAVFDEEYKRVVELADGSTQSLSAPVLGVREILFPVPPQQGDTAFIPSKGQLYAVADVQPDGHGHILLILVEASA